MPLPGRWGARPDAQPLSLRHSGPGAARYKGRLGLAIPADSLHYIARPLRRARHSARCDVLYRGPPELRRSWQFQDAYQRDVLGLVVVKESRGGGKVDCSHHRLAKVEVILHHLDLHEGLELTFFPGFAKIGSAPQDFAVSLQPA